MMRALLAALAIVAASAATASDVTGLWTRDDGSAKLRFSACGAAAVCGYLAWKKEPGGAAKIGQKLFSGMKPNGKTPGLGPRSIPMTAGGTQQS